MIDDKFEGRFADALRGYAAEAPTELDPVAFAHSIAAARPRRAGWASMLGRPQLRALAWLLVVALLAVTALALAGVGGPRLVDDATTPEWRPPLSRDLYGEWEADVRVAGPNVPAGRYILDLNAASILRGPDGRDLDWSGAATAIGGDPRGSVELTVGSSDSCATGRYLLREASAAPPGGPSPAPLDGVGVAPEFWDHIRLDTLDDACTARVAVLTAGQWTRTRAAGQQLGPFVPGETYSSGTFTEPFRFVMPAVAGDGENEGLPAQFRLASRYVSDGGLWFGGPWWSMVIVDDLPVYADLCDRTGDLLPDVPSTPEEIRAWLQTGRGWTVSQPIPVPVDGRTAMRFDLEEKAAPASCEGGRLPLGGYFTYMMRAYAIPTGHDTILLVGGSDGVNWEAVSTAIDEIVRSMDFQ